MPESGNTETVDQDAKHEHSPRKRIRHRKKQLYENILKQMEFYFSDANLTKDRFLGDLVKKDPYVSLETFLKFNKIRSLTQDTNDIAKAMKHSTLLELSEDRLKVRRKTPLLPYNADLRTVYVESIPVTASREWVERVFSDYGPVAYISLPKFKNSQRIKGYAFIEYTKPEDAQKCLNTFTKMGCKLPTCMPPEELSSIKMFSVDEPDEMPIKHEKVEKDVYEPPVKHEKDEKDVYEPPVKHEKDEKDVYKPPIKHEKDEKDVYKPPIKHEKDEKDVYKPPVKHEKDEKDVYEPPKKKKKKEKRPQKGLDLKLDHYSESEKKVETPTDETKSITTPTEDDNKSIITPTEENKTPEIECKDELTSQDEAKHCPDQGTPRKKKSRKRAKENTKSSLGKNEAPKGALWGLQVLPKSEWKALRNKYLNLQRKYMKDVKEQLQNKRYKYSSIPAPAAPSVDVEPVNPSSEAEGTKTVVKLERIPGVFVKEILPEPCLDVRLTKRTIRSNVHALHVDVKEGQTEVIIRFDSADAANEYCANSGNESRPLSSAEESEQWSRADQARSQRRPRGRCRLEALRARATAAPALAPASPQPTHTHIRFDD